MNTLRTKREAKGLTQQQLAAKAGIKRSLYSLIELGVCNPSIQVALAIASALDSTVDEIFAPLNTLTVQEKL